MAIAVSANVTASATAASTITVDFGGAVDDDDWVYCFCSADSTDNTGEWDAETGWKRISHANYGVFTAVYQQKASTFTNPVFDWSGTADDLSVVGVAFSGVHGTVPLMGGIVSRSFGTGNPEASPAPVDVLYSWQDNSWMVAAACLDDNDFDTNYEISGWTKVNSQNTGASSVAVCRKAVGTAPSAESVGTFAALAAAASEQGVVYSMILVPDTATAGGGAAGNLFNGLITT